MKRIYILLILTLFLGCNSTKKVEKAMLSGDYDKAINLALDQIQKGKDNNKTQEQILILQQAFKKYQDNQLERIKLLQKEQRAENEEAIYQYYKSLYQTQQAIKPVLPLYYDGKRMKFKFEDISSELIMAKQNYAEYLYQLGNSYMSNKEIMAYRSAFDVFNELNQLMPNYKDTTNLMDESLALGIDYIIVKAFNNTGVSIPKALEQDILDFNIYGLQDQWKVYHANQEDGNPYQFQINLVFENIIFSPDRLIEKEIKVEKNIEITETQTNSDGKVKKDSLGNEINLKRNITVEGMLNTITQNKTVAIVAQVDYINLEDNQKINDYKLDSQFLFENVFAKFEGDERALDAQQKKLLKGQLLPFPSNEQMLFDASEDIKLKLKSILRRHELR